MPHLFHGKQETADRSPEGGGDSCSGTGADEVPPVLGVPEPLEEGQVEAQGLGLRGEERCTTNQFCTTHWHWGFELHSLFDDYPFFLNCMQSHIPSYYQPRLRWADSGMNIEIL